MMSEKEIYYKYLTSFFKDLHNELIASNNCKKNTLGMLEDRKIIVVILKRTTREQCLSKNAYVCL